NSFFEAMDVETRGPRGSLRIFRALFSKHGATLSFMNQPESNALFAGLSAAELAAIAAASEAPVSDAPPRLRMADRSQMTIRPCCLEELLPLDHEARNILKVVC